ncbi:MAG: HtaA domain-containing protein [Pseudomonadota bacterium]
MSISKMTWGVKESFRNYVEGAGGSISVADGASRAEDGAFVLTAIDGGDLNIAEDGSASGSMRFQGTITFEAHGGMLNSTLTEIGLEAGEDGLVVTAQHAQLKDNRCDIAKLNLVEGGPHDAMTFRAEITLDGMYQIADNYPPGTELDSLRLE